MTRTRRPNRRHFTLKLLTGFALLFLSFSKTVSSAQQSPAQAETTEGRKLPLKEQLTLGLKATTKEDKEFINNVVLKVEQGAIPRPLVDSTFLWARERANRKSASRSLRPIVYFKPGLIARAKMLRLSL
jgi:hypothetical protein